MLSVLISVMTAGCQSLVEDLALRETDRESYIVHWEIRTPTNWSSLNGIQIELVTNDSGSKGPIQNGVETRDLYCTYKGDFLIGRDVRRFILVEQSHKSVLVYPLDIPKVGRPADWTAWHLADFLDSSEDTSWNLMNNKNERLIKASAKDIPLELRYRVEKNPFSLYDAYHKKN